jgi:hypothetical protein
MRFVLNSCPSLTFSLEQPPRHGITVRIFVNRLLEWMARRLATDEWVALNKPTQEIVRSTFQRRTGSAYGPSAITRGETPYLVQDVLGAACWFLAIHRRTNKNREDVYLLHTTTANHVRSWR